MSATPALYKGKIKPGPVGWTRIGLTLIVGVVLAAFSVLTMGTGGFSLGILIMLGFVGYAVWAYLKYSLTFVVDDRGVTVSLGGLFPRKTWPLSDFRTVQLRSVPQDRVGSTLGDIGFGRGRVAVSTLAEVTPVEPLKARTLPGPQVRSSFAVTRGGTLVEIIGKDGGAYLLGPEDPTATARAIANFIVFTR